MAHEEIKALFGEMFANAIVGHLSPDRKQREDSNRIVFFFDTAVDALRSPLFPNVPVNEAVTLMWRLIGNRMIPSAAGPVPTLSFTALGNDPKHLNAAVLVPANWPDLVAQNYKYQLGGIVFVASQCRDWYNGKLIVKPENLVTPTWCDEQSATKRATSVPSSNETPTTNSTAIRNTFWRSLPTASSPSAISPMSRNRLP